MCSMVDRSDESEGHCITSTLFATRRAVWGAGIVMLKYSVPLTLFDVGNHYWSKNIVTVALSIQIPSYDNKSCFTIVRNIAPHHH